MATKITFQTSIAVAGGMTRSDSRSIDVEAFDLIQVLVLGGDPATPGQADVDVQPSDATQVQFLYITSDRYSTAAHPMHLKYSVDGGTADVALDNEQLFVGQGAIKLLGAPKKLTFANGLGAGNDANVTILVGRDATP
jgi:hypothetical protein